jgi:hypothetical protein
MSETLIELFEITGKNDFEFTYKTGEGENIINLDLENKKISVFIGDLKDGDLNLKLSNVLNELKETFK